MIRVYGVPWSRASRCLWMLEELGVEYENVLVLDAKNDESYRAINPNGRVPALVDGDLVMWESLAINLYLARRIPSDLSPKSLAEEAHALKWTLWAQSEWETLFANAGRIEEVDAERLARLLHALDSALEETGYLIDGRFTVADLNVANMFNGPVSGRLDLSRHPHVAKWLAAARARPAARSVLERIKETLAARR